MKMDPEKAYKKYLKRAAKDHSGKKTMDKRTFITFWNLSDVFRDGIVEYIKETEKI